MDKGRRAQLVKLRHMRRCRVRGLDPKESYDLKAQGKPCSCYLCSSNKYRRAVKHKSNADYDTQHNRRYGDKGNFHQRISPLVYNLSDIIEKDKEVK